MQFIVKAEHVVGALAMWIVTCILRLFKSFFGELVALEFKKLFKENEKMGFSKVIPIGSAGSLSLNESAGGFSAVVSLQESVGGGAAAGAAQAKASIEFDIAGKQLMDLSLDLLAAKFPSLSAEIALIKAAADAEVAKA